MTTHDGQEPPEASVVIACFNGASTIGEQLEALANQEDPPRFEVLIVDNNSTDSLHAACAPYEDRLVIRSLSAHEAAGGSYARNVGVLQARGQHVLICDQDDVVAATWVRTMHDELLRADVMVTGPVEAFTLNSPEVARIFTQSEPETLVRPFVVQGYLPFVHGCNFGLRRDSYLEVRGMDNSYNGGDEDTDFCWRVQESGRDVVCLDGATVAYRLRELPSQLFRQRRAYARGRVLTVVRSQRLGRNVSGMSFKWALKQAAALPWGWLTSRRDPASRLSFARHSGAILGNLSGQVRYRLLRRLPEPATLDHSPFVDAPRSADR